MKGYILSPAAQADLNHIWNYSARNWGEAERYVSGIRDTCQALADGSRQGRAIDDIRPGYRKLASCRRSATADAEFIGRCCTGLLQRKSVIRSAAFVWATAVISRIVARSRALRHPD